MPTNNLFWSQYQALEKEFLKATRFITFDDNHLEVYSEQFIDILMRTWVEIEAISKKLYFDNGGQPKIGDDLYFDTDCIKFLDSLWHICDKELHVDNINFYFTQQDVIVFKPLHKCDKRGTSGSKWKQAYQAVKHDRIANYKKANLLNCLKSLGALYLLNVYLKDLQLKNITFSEKEKFDFHLGSEMFIASNDEDLSTSPRIAKTESLVCIRINEEQRKRMNDSLNQANENTRKRVVDEIQRIVNERGLEENIQKQIDEVLKGIDTQSIQIQEIKRTNIGREFKDLRVDIYLNK